VYSEPGNGSTFKVLFPAAQGEVPDSGSGAPITQFRGEGTILVVDDEELVLRTVETALERYGYNVLTATGGSEAISLLETDPNQISLVLLDMTMPHMTGEQTLRRMLAVRPDLPVIATSGYNEIEALRRFGSGLRGFVQKPYVPRKLAEKIRTVLGS
jgi:CheY-like chemotaxis protein